MPRKILLADDSVTAQNMGKKILSDAGYQVFAVSNGSAALKKASELKPDVIVLDVYMPGYSGLEVCKRLKESPETAGIPVLLTVGKLEPFKPEESKKAGADAFIVKPFEASELLAVVEKLEAMLAAKPEVPKSRLSRMLSSLEESAPPKPAPSAEDGWKSRLTIPAKQASKSKGAAKPEEQEEDISSFGTGFRDLREEDSLREPEKTTEAASRDTFLTANAAEDNPGFEGFADITPEEIQAIQAAASLLNSDGADKPAVVVEPEAQLEPAQAESVQAESFHAESVHAELAIPEPVADASNVGSISEAKVSETTSPEVTVTETSATNISKAEVFAEGITPAEATPVAEAAVVEAVTVEAQVVEPSAVEPSIVERAAVEPLVESSTASVSVSGPTRWVAEPVTLGESESEQLGRDIQQYLAGASRATADLAAESLAAIGATLAASPDVVTANATADEAVKSVEAISANVSEVSAAEVSEPAVIASAGVPESVQAVAQAAAAYAGDASSTTVFASSAPVLQPEPSPEPAAAAVNETGNEKEAKPPAEMAAVWSNWRDIRESVVGASLTQQLADLAGAAAEGTHAASYDSHSSSHESPQASSHASGPGSFGAAFEIPSTEAVADVLEGATGPSESIASIVDNMLAELKPKLIAEITRKMEKK